VLLENCFNCIISGNKISNSRGGIHAINYSMDNSPDPFKSDKDYKDLITGTVITKNDIQATKAIRCAAVRGNELTDNTIIGLTSFEIYGVGCKEWKITKNQLGKLFIHNIVSMTFDYNSYTEFQATIYQQGTRSFTQWQADGFDVHSCLSCSPPINTPSYTPSQTAIPPTTTRTDSPTPTRTATPTVMPAENMCMKIVWSRGLSIRPGASLNTIPDGQYSYNKTIPIEGIVSKTEIINRATYVETWGQINRAQFAAIKINSTVYAQIVACP